MSDNKGQPAAVDVDVDEVLGSLKDFQQATSRWAFKRMFDDVDPALRFLVADEVGLGKTHVAKGVVAQVIDYLRRTGDKRHDIVYICSNSAIARQNIRKLLPSGVQALDSVDRLTMLPVAKLNESTDGLPAINMLAITPGTSLKFGRTTGRFKERVAAYAFMRELWGAAAFNRRGRWIFWEGVDPKSGDERLKRQAKTHRAAVRGRGAALAETLADIDAVRADRGHRSLREMFDALDEGLRWKKQFPAELKPMRAEFMAEIRRAMATVGIKMLQPDLIILDEFQRFKDILDPDRTDWSADLANRLFTYKDSESGRPTRTLLLSATPYRMYTTATDSDADHYADFLATCRFLFGDPVKVDLLAKRFRDLRIALTQPGGVELAAETCRAISSELQRVMARTERLAATPDRDGMLRELLPELRIESADLEAYLQIGNLTQTLDQNEPTEFWKSSPFLVNFMENYKLKETLVDALDSGLVSASRDLADGPGLLNWTDVDNYAKIDPQNARLRWLLDDLDAHGAFRLLWLPPSLPYYTAGTNYETEEARSFTKRLVFSGWAVVPKVISVMASHEAERAAFGETPDQKYSDEYARRGGQRLAFRMDGSRRAAAMTNLAVIWPSPTLADVGACRPAAQDTPTVGVILAQVRDRLAPMIDQLIIESPTAGAVDARWYWAAPLLLDSERFPAATDRWFGQFGAEDYWSGSSSGAEGGFEKHLDEAWSMIIDESEPLGRPPTDLTAVLAEVAVGSPAVCALRSIGAVVGLPLDHADALSAAARCSWGFRNFFNAPDVTALVVGGEGTDGHLPYWRQVIGHCVGGNLQAVMDEHVHVLKDWLGFSTIASDAVRISDAAEQIAEKVAEALDIRTASFRVDIPATVDGNSLLAEHRMRSRFAAAFGNQRTEDGGEARIDSVAAAFNSPFWPFVLATTSVGQEGLDFHLWCHAVVHWNLPSNPVDLEQREGRVHRYKGHAVRKNIADSVAVPSDGGDVWASLFELASSWRGVGDTEMVPYWVFPEGPAKIERHVPMLPFSREAAALPRLKAALATYRLAFGQPRQEELIEFLSERVPPDELNQLIESLRIDLTPPVHI